MPTTKLTCLTLYDISSKPEITLKEGYATTAKVSVEKCFIFENDFII